MCPAHESIAGRCGWRVSTPFPFLPIPQVGDHWWSETVVIETHNVTFDLNCGLHMRKHKVDRTLAYALQNFTDEQRDGIRVFIDLLKAAKICWSKTRKAGSRQIGLKGCQIAWACVAILRSADAADRTTTALQWVSHFVHFFANFDWETLTLNVVQYQSRARRETLLSAERFQRCFFSAVSQS